MHLFPSCIKIFITVHYDYMNAFDIPIRDTKGHTICVPPPPPYAFSNEGTKTVYPRVVYNSFPKFSGS